MEIYPAQFESWQEGSAEMHALRAKNAKLSAILKAMREMIYEQPIGAWFGVIDEALKE